MTLPSAIKGLIITLGLLFCSIGFSQNTLDADEPATEQRSTFYNAVERQRFFAITVGGHIPFTSGDNFMGEGLEGKSGFDFKVQMYVYKHLFVGLSTGSSYFEVKNQELLGLYKKSRVAYDYVYIGYEFFPADKLRLGVNISIDGNLAYKNYDFNTLDINHQKDTATLNRYGFYLNYELGKHFMIYLDYGYNVSKTDIEVPSELNDFFGKGNYSTIGLGLAFTIGSRDLISRFVK
ncbi:MULTISPECIES: outer membrane beta-barrel protein [Winogradskyella]|uniref:outer membrane beta-barrel protein n=1 Tax=Winogradskyella TaxID=286104 RepID=UPI0015C8BBED|nr:MULTISPECIES: outer membrane beta-barrel protein [Winogradskyella]QXP80426.1 hypothetical protein H0I32_07345 [Winogradskyella sp. HaHa_3_26]